MNLFFPSHDIALGNGVKHFNPPKAAQMLQDDLAWLEQIFAEERPQPWGWNWDTREHLARHYHINRAALPSDQQLEQLRQLSNRRTIVDLLNYLHYEGVMPQYLDSEEALARYVDEADASRQEFVLKTPWSSSGRGLIRSSVVPRSILLQRANATIHKMGGIMGEYWLNKEQDFALLFYVGTNEIKFLGYSLFENESNGTYRQGYLLSNEAIEERLTSSKINPEGCSHQSHLSLSTLINLREQISEFLTNTFEPFFCLLWEVGYLGIDMMTLKDSPLAWACCEMNLRCTMGIVARLWADKHLNNKEEGRFTISPMGKDGHFEAHFLVK